MVAEGALLAEPLRGDPGRRASGRRQATSEGVGLRRRLHLPAPGEPRLPAPRPARISGLAPPPGCRADGAVRGGGVRKLSALASGVALRRLHHPGTAARRRPFRGTRLGPHVARSLGRPRRALGGASPSPRAAGQASSMIPGSPLRAGGAHSSRLLRGCRGRLPAPRFPQQMLPQGLDAHRASCPRRLQSPFVTPGSGSFLGVGSFQQGDILRRAARLRSTGYTFRLVLGGLFDG